VKRRAFQVALLLLGLTSALLVARLPPDLEGRIVAGTQPDPLLTAALLQLNVASLLQHPHPLLQLPSCSPTRTPTAAPSRSGRALLALPFRLVLGERPALVYTAVLITTLLLVAVFTGLLLRELGVRACLALAAGCLSVLVATTTIFVDRLQSLSIQWLPLGLYFAARYLKHGGRLRLVAFGACAFLTVQASLYTTVMIASAVLFVWPLAWARGTNR
jgi:hypothetical protein